jgi:glutaredoxin
MAIEKFVNSCRPGVEQAALDAAQTLGLKQGGVCEGNRTVPDRYPVKRWSTDPELVALRNIEEAHGVIVIFNRPIGEYENAIKRTARGMGKTCVLVDLGDHHHATKLQEKLRQVRSELAGCRIINIAGPARPELYRQTRHFLKELFS